MRLPAQNEEYGNAESSKYGQETVARIECPATTKAIARASDAIEKR